MLQRDISKCLLSNGLQSPASSPSKHVFVGTIAQIERASIALIAQYPFLKPMHAVHDVGTGYLVDFDGKLNTFLTPYKALFNEVPGADSKSP